MKDTEYANGVGQTSLVTDEMRVIMKENSRWFADLPGKLSVDVGKNEVKGDAFEEGVEAPGGTETHSPTA